MVNGMFKCASNENKGSTKLDMIVLLTKHKLLTIKNYHYGNKILQQSSKGF